MMTAKWTKLPPAILDQLRAGLRGELLQRGDEGYDEARRVWNGMIDRYPALIVRCATVADVVATVKVAREHDLLVSVRAGGHGVTGNAVADGALMIDLSGMKSIHVDPVAQIARAAAGVLQGEFDRETQAFGLATTGGEVSHTGIAGLTLGGGLGWLMRQYGYTVDNLLSVDVVTADGRLLKASAIEHPELFWGLRGGGGNFGMATSFEYQLHRVGPIVLSGLLLYPLDEAREVLRFFRDFATAAQDELTVRAVFMTAPPAPFVPEHLVGRQILALPVLYVGPIDDGERAVAPLRTFREPAADLIDPMPYTTLQQLVDPSVPHGLRYYNKFQYLAGLPDMAIDTILDHVAAVPSPLTVSMLYPMGGAVRRFPEDHTAMGNRNAEFFLWTAPAWTDPADFEVNRSWARSFCAAMDPYATGRVYANGLETDTPDQVRAAFSPQAYQRLVALKNKYDLTNFFQLNQNINRG
jgi:FAD/FMN-containing dehydrogenase